MNNMGNGNICKREMSDGLKLMQSKETPDSDELNTDMFKYASKKTKQMLNILIL